MRDPWQSGRCGTYAVALIALDPRLRFGVAGYIEDDGWSAQHFYAHNNDHAYDSLGQHPLPYLGINGQFDFVLLDETPKDYGVPDDEAGPEGAQAAIAQAQAHALSHSILSTTGVPA